MVGVFRGAKDWNKPNLISSLKSLSRIKTIAESEWKEQKDSVAQGDLATALVPPKLEVSIRKNLFKEGEESSIECVVSWQGETGLYSFKTPRLITPDGVEQKGNIRSFSATDQHGAKLVYTIPVLFDSVGKFTLGPVELSFRSRLGGEEQFTRSTTIEVDVERPWWRNWWFWGGLVSLLLISVLVMIYINTNRNKDKTTGDGVVANESLKNELSAIQKLKIQASKREYESELLRINAVQCLDENERIKIEKMREEISYGGRELSGDEIRYYEKIFKKLDEENI